MLFWKHCVIFLHPQVAQHCCKYTLSCYLSLVDSIHLFSWAALVVRDQRTMLTHYKAKRLSSFQISDGVVKQCAPVRLSLDPTLKFQCAAIKL